LHAPAEREHATGELITERDHCHSLVSATPNKCQKTLEWAIQYAKKKECNILQLTSNKQRRNAIKFYENLGFEATHEGFKLNI
jgi:GNAT superfamily N-acetyltransferase